MPELCDMKAQVRIAMVGVCPFCFEEVGTSSEIHDCSEIHTLLVKTAGIAAKFVQSQVNKQMAKLEAEGRV